MTKQDGSVVSRHDYLPFGEEIPDNVGGRSTSYGYLANASLTQRFTGKERDSETGLDYFGARYLSSAQGRWTSADAPFADQSEIDPRTWNLYSYVRNAPSHFRDLTGRECVNLDGGGVGDDGKPGTPCPDSSGINTTHGTTVSVGSNQLALMMLRGVGDALSSGHQWAGVASGAGKHSVALTNPVAAAAASCLEASALGKPCSRSEVILAVVPYGPGRLAHILRRHSFASVAKNVSRFAKGLDETHVNAIVESALTAPNRATGLKDGVAYVDANIGVVIGTDISGKPTTWVRVVLDNLGNVHTAYPVANVQ